MGCRTYGGYGSEAETLEQIEAAHETFTRDLAQAQADLRALTSAAEPDSLVMTVANRMQSVVLVHEATLEEHAERLAEAQENTGSYRFLSRTLGGMLSDQEVIYLRYRDILQTLEAMADTARVDSAPAGATQRYHVAPPFYERLRTRAYTHPTGEIGRALMDNADRVEG